MLRGETGAERPKPTRAQTLGCLAIIALLLFGVIEARYYTNRQSDNVDAWSFRGAQIEVDLRQVSAAQTSGNSFDLAKTAQSLAQHCHGAEGLPHGSSSAEQHTRAACAAAGFPLPAP